jgi:hypothetical protein
MAKKKTTDTASAPPAAPRRRASTKKAEPTASATPGVAATAPLTLPDLPGAGNGGGSQPSRAEIAEAAYFRHLNRRGGQGDEFTDWIEAERELKQRQAR